MELKISSGLAAACRKSSPERLLWLEQLPEVVDKLQREWGLRPDAPLDGEEPTCSFVAAVLTASGVPAVLKISMPHMEGEHEIQGLRFWDGEPTVRLLHANEDSGAMLLERCRPGTALLSLDESEQDVVIAGLLRRMWRSPSGLHPFRALSVMTAYWARETRTYVKEWPDPGLVREGLRLFEELPRTAAREVLLATDLHAGNVLRAEREPWLVIDPKPFVGDPAYDATQHLFNCYARLRSDPNRTIRRLAELLEVDHTRVRLWTFARLAAEPREDWNNAGRLELSAALMKRH